MANKSNTYTDGELLKVLTHSLHTLGFEMPIDHHTLMDGKVHLYKRSRSRFWQCSTYLGGINHRQSTKEEALVLAKEFAQDWYMQVYAQERRRRRALIEGHDERDAAPQKFSTDLIRKRPRKASKGPTFKDAFDVFKAEFSIITQGERSPLYVERKFSQTELHLIPYFGHVAVADVTAGMVQEYRLHRQSSRTDPKTGEAKRPSRSSLHQEIVALRQILKTANRKGWIDSVPDLSAPYKSSGKVQHRAWFSRAEYKILYEHTRERAKNPPKPRWRTECENFHDYVIFMGNTGLRPDECSRLEERDVSIVPGHARGKILRIEVRGKRGTGLCMSMPSAVLAFERIKKRKKLKPTDLIFGKAPREIMNKVLNELNMKFDREGNLRTCYSLRHTYICLRLLEGADIYQVSKNCRTSVEMIEKYYARHIESSIDTAAINVRSRKPRLAKRSDDNIKKS